MKTLTTVLFLGCLISVALVFSYQISSYKAMDHKLALNYMIAKLFQSCAYFLYLFRDVGNNFLSVNLGNSCLILGFYFEALSILIISQNNKKSLNIFLNVLVVFSLIAFNIIEFLYKDASFRVAFSSISVFLLLIIPSILLIISKTSTNFKRSVGCFYLFFLLILLPRIIYTLYNPKTSLFANQGIHILTFLSLILLTIYSLSAYLLLMKEATDKIIASMATTDFLSGILNRYSFLDAATLMFEKCKQQNTPITILFCDIDYFKKINDTYGHSFGDMVIKRFADILRKILRASDLSCRYGGEEFLLLISHDITAGRAVAHRIMEEVKNIQFDEQADFHFTVSIGIATSSLDEKFTLDNYIDHADQALYYAKNTGRNKIVEYSSIKQ